MRIKCSSTVSGIDMQNAFETKLAMLKAEPVNSAVNVTASWYDDGPEDTQGWVKKDHKYVLDSDGFSTDYTLWYNEITDEWCTVFGDNDLYHPWDSYHDMDFENNEREAYSWFSDYSSEDEL